MMYPPDIYESLVEVGEFDHAQLPAPAKLAIWSFRGGSSGSGPDLPTGYIFDRTRTSLRARAIVTVWDRDEVIADGGNTTDLGWFDVPIRFDADE